MKNSVFISYSSKDENIACDICNFLEKYNIKCWVSYRDIPGGEEWAKAINDAIKISSIMILVFSENSNTSSQVAKEVNLAINSGLTIIPYRIDQTKPTGSMEYYLSDTQWIQCENHKSEDEYEVLKSTIESNLVSIKKKNIKDSPKTSHKSIMVTIIVVVVLAILLAGILNSFDKQNDWDGFVEKYYMDGSTIVGGEEGVKKEKLSNIDDSFGLINDAKIKSDSIDDLLELDKEHECMVKIETQMKPTSIYYWCGNNGPTGTITENSISYDANIVTVMVPAFPRSTDGFSSGDRYRIRIVVAYEDPISIDFYEVEKFYFDKNVKVK